MVDRRICVASLVLVAAAAVAAGCSSSAVSTESTGTTASEIQGGVLDTNPPHPFAVGVCVGAPNKCGQICSGALIAPNLVLTARHCVDTVPATVDCTSPQSVFGAQHAPTSQFYITTNGTIWQATKGWHAVKKIIRTPGVKLCGSDMALLELGDNVGPSEAAMVTPVLQYSMTDHTRYSTTVTAIGYGLDSPSNGNSAGTRRIRQNINLVCIPGDKSIDCGDTGGQVAVSEFLSGDGTCSGDSGSSAYEQKNFNNSVPVSFGVLSRGGESNGFCLGGVYTRTDAFKSLIVQTAQQAAIDGNYPVPSWTVTPVPPSPDAGTPPPAPGTGVLGEACADVSDCASRQCQSADGTNSICTQVCDGSAGSCPDAYTCSDGGFCFPSPPPPPPVPGAATTTTTTTSCSVGAPGVDPTKPVPWKTGGIVAVIGLALTRLRRRAIRETTREDTPRRSR